MPRVNDLREREAQKLEKAREAVEIAVQAVIAAQAHQAAVEAIYAQVELQVKENIAAIDRVIRLNQEATEEEKTTPCLNLPQEDAMRFVLNIEARKMNSSELAEKMKAHGYVFASANPPNAVVVASNTNRRGYFTTEKEGNRTLIGLKEWVVEPEEQSAA